MNNNSSSNKNIEFKVLIIIALVITVLEIIGALIAQNPFSSFIVLVSLTSLLSLSCISSAIAYILNYKNFYTCDNCQYCYKAFKVNYVTTLTIFYVVVGLANLIFTFCCFINSDFPTPIPLIIVAGINLFFFVSSLPTKMIFSKYNLKLLSVEYLHQINKKLNNLKE